MTERRGKKKRGSRSAAPKHKVIEVPDLITVRELADLMEVSPIDVIKTLMEDGIMASINQSIDYETAAIVAEDMGFQAKERVPPAPEVVPLPEKPPRPPEGEARLPLRPPVVTVMGHVNHGKTSLLDVIRRTNVVAGEAGGITQHIGAYQVERKDKRITFIDTPGHEAFTAMRARGAQVTDIAVLVIAADDGVMLQTIEAIDHARAAEVPIIVALNKMDKNNADPERVKKQLADIGFPVEEWGGDVICVPVSAKEQTGIDDLLEAILLVTEMSELRADPNCPAVGTVIEGSLDRSMGPMASVLVQNGTLKLGDNIVVGDICGKVRAMFDDEGKRVKRAGPSMPVAVLGLPTVPQAGEAFEVLPDDSSARVLAAERAEERRQAVPRPPRIVSLDDLYARIQAGKVKELNIILKVDVQGSIEPLRESLEKLSTEELKVRFIRQATGNITESDIMLAIASQAIVIGFNVQADPAARLMAEVEGVDVRFYNVIYDLIEDIEKAVKGLLEPKYEEVVIGHAEVRAIFNIPHKGKVAGLYVNDGKVTRDALARITRGEGEVVYDGQVSSLKRFAEDVKEVNSGYECGLGLEGFEDFKEGDIIELYRKERVS